VDLSTEREIGAKLQFLQELSQPSKLAPCPHPGVRHKSTFGRVIARKTLALQKLAAECGAIRILRQQRRRIAQTMSTPECNVGLHP
jgi:hypothetical protein